jgi:hypothetical protein
LAVLRIAKLAGMAIFVVAALLGVLQLCPSRGWAQDFGQAGRIAGDWCAQGDKTKHCSISSKGPVLTFTNETDSTSTGHFVNTQQTVFSADEWRFVQGTLSPDGLRIDWSNGTYWLRCGSGGGSGHRPNLDGTWYRDGNRAQVCSIRQKKGDLRLKNEGGQTATGSFNDSRHITTNWPEGQIDGTISPDGNTINWDNGTSWSR